MKAQIVLALVALAAVVLARPSDDVVDFETDKMEVEQEGIPGKAVSGSYSWTAPNGEEYEVKYTADHNGFRVHETDAVATFRDAGMPADVQEDEDEPEIADERDAGEEEEEDEGEAEEEDDE